MSTDPTLDIWIEPQRLSFPFRFRYHRSAADEGRAWSEGSGRSLTDCFEQAGRLYRQQDLEERMAAITSDLAKL